MSTGEAESHLRAGLERVGENRIVEAEDELSRASELDPDDPRVWTALALSRLMQAKHEAAEGAARRATKLGSVGGTSAEFIAVVGARPCSRTSARPPS
jgi:Flp pilus assembly protein TadD